MASNRELSRLVRHFSETAQSSPEYREAYDIVRANSSGRIWLIGGFVYRTLASQLYDTPRPEIDLDFLVENPTSRLSPPRGWEVAWNRFGNPKLLRGKDRIDIVPLDSVYSIRLRGLEPTVENFLTGAPLNVQSIAFDIEADRVVGDVGLGALRERTVAVNDLCFAEYAAKKKGLPLHEMIRKKADELRFAAVYPTTYSSEK
jgi:hypothetical protein